MRTHVIVVQLSTIISSSTKVNYVLHKRTCVISGTIYVSGYLRTYDMCVLKLFYSVKSNSNKML